MPLVRVCQVDEMADESMRRITANGHEIMVAKTNGQYYALAERCTHRGGPLSEGTLDRKIVTCPWHFGQFNLETGEVVSPPPPEPLQKYEVKVEDETIYVSIP